LAVCCRVRSTCCCIETPDKWLLDGVSLGGANNGASILACFLPLMEVQAILGDKCIGSRQDAALLFQQSKQELGLGHLQD